MRQTITDLLDPLLCHVLEEVGSRTIEFQLRLWDLLALCKGTIALHVKRLDILPALERKSRTSEMLPEVLNCIDIS